MADGDLVVADYMGEVRTTAFGVGTNYGLRHSNISGLGVPVAKASDVDLDEDDGSYASPDYQGSRIIVFSLIFKGTPAAVGGYLKTWQTSLWVPAGSSLTIPLYLQLPGLGKFHVNGSPRGFDADISKINNGLVTAEATFVCPDPTITYP